MISSKLLHYLLNHFGLQEWVCMSCTSVSFFQHSHGAKRKTQVSQKANSSALGRKRQGGGDAEYLGKHITQLIKHLL